MLPSAVGGDFFLKSTTISFVLLAFHWRALVSHQPTKSLMTPLYSCSFPYDTYPKMAVSSENFWMWQWAELCLKSEVYRLNRKGERTTTSDTQSWSLTYCGLLVRYSMVHAVRCSSTPAPSSFPLSTAGWMVLKALGKKTWPSQCSPLAPCERKNSAGDRWQHDPLRG